MRIKRTKLKKGRLEIVPMIDTFFILLIFYMMFATFHEIEMEWGIKVPVAPDSNKLKKTSSDLLLNIVGPDKIIVNKVVYDLEGLSRYVSDVASTANENISIMIRANKDISYTEIDKVLKRCAELGIVNVTFVTVQKSS